MTEALDTTPEPQPADVLTDAAPNPVETGDPAPEVPAAVDPTVPGSTDTQAQPPADPFEEFGGRDTIERAHRLWTASQTEDGVIQLFLEAGRNLGLPLEKMQQLFTGSAPAETDPFADDPDMPMTKAEFQAWQQRQSEAVAAANRVQQEQIARTAVATAFGALGVDVKDTGTTQWILQAADRHMAGKPVTAENIDAAVRQGHAELQALIDRNAQQYLRTKQQQAASVPSAPAGPAAPAPAPEPEPKNVSEAIKAARKRLGLAA